jgi:hypothetical protein
VRSIFVALSVAFVFCVASLLPAQTQTSTAAPTANSVQAQTALQSSLAALGGATVKDITLTGTAERIAGSDEETGTVTYTAIPSASRLELSLSGGVRSEIRAFGTKGPGGNWIGPDGAVHQIPQHNLHTDPGWFPIFTLANLSASATVMLTYIGPETKNGISVIHIQTAQQQPNITPASAAKMYPHLTQMDIYLDASTYRPVALDFNIHPDYNTLQDIPVEFQFSDYTAVDSLSVPFHVQEYINGSLYLDLQFKQVSVNSGLSSSSSIFAIQ